MPAKKSNVLESVRGKAPKKGQLPLGLIKWLKANGRMRKNFVVKAG